MRRSRSHFVHRVHRAALGLAVLAQACAAPPVPRTSSDPTPPEPPPAAVSESLLPPLSFQPEPPVEDAEPRFDVSVNQAPARECLMSLVENTPYNMVVHPGVDGRVSLSLKDVTVEEVLETLRQVYGYEYRRTSDGFVVLPTGLRTRVFEIDYLHLQRQGHSQTRVSSGQISDKALGGGDAGEGSSTTGQTGTSATSGTQIETITQADLWNELIAGLRAIVGDRDGHSVVASPNAGVIVVSASGDRLAVAEKFLASAERSMARQVILEAKILEVVLDDGFQAGINWVQLASHNKDRLAAGQIGGGSVFDTGASEISGSAIDLGPPLADLLAGTGTSAFGGVFTLALQAKKFSAFIELLESQGDVNTLSSPRISTVNNQKAVIKVGSDEFFVTDISTTTVTGTTTTTNPSVTLTPFFSGIALDVTPQISAQGEVVLHVHPSVSEVVDQTKQINVGGEPLTLPLALSQIRESDSIIRARSGQVVVIGGLMQTSMREDRGGIPWISRIPFLGAIFRHSRTREVKSELVILLRPIVVGPDTWDERLRATASRYQDYVPRFERADGLHPFEHDRPLQDAMDW